MGLLWTLLTWSGVFFGIAYGLVGIAYLMTLAQHSFWNRIDGVIEKRIEEMIREGRLQYLEHQPVVPVSEPVDLVSAPVLVEISSPEDSPFDLGSDPPTEEVESWDSGEESTPKLISMSSQK